MSRSIELEKFCQHEINCFALFDLADKVYTYLIKEGREENWLDKLFLIYLIALV